MYGCAVMQPPCQTSGSAAGRRGRGGSRRAPVEARHRRCRRGATAGRVRAACAAGDDLDVVDADAAEHRGAELLVAAAEQRALTADDADDRASPALVREQREQIRARRGRRRRAAGPDRVDAEQRLRQAQMAAITRRSSCPGRARRSGAGPSSRDRRAQTRRARRRREARRPSWRPARAAGRRARARRRRAASRCVPARSASSSTSTTSASRRSHRRVGETNAAATSPALSGRGREDGRVHLHAGRDAEHRHARRRRRRWMSRAVPSPPAKRIRSTPRRTSSAAAARVSAAVVVAVRRPGLAAPTCRAPADSQIGAHLVRRRQHRQVVATAPEPGQRPLGAAGCDRASPRAGAPRRRHRPCP